MRPQARRPGAPVLEPPESWLAVEDWPVLVAYIDAGLVYRFANRAYAASLGLHPDAIPGCCVQQIEGADRCGLLQAPMRAALAGSPIRFETQWDAPGEPARMLDVHYLPSRPCAGEADGFHLIAFDVTDLRLAEREGVRLAQALQLETVDRLRAEAALRQSQKMEAVGQLTSGLAHDFNNLLMTAMGALDAARGRSQIGDPLGSRRAFDIAETAVSRASDLAARLLSFAKPLGSAREPTDANGLIRALSDLLRLALPPGVQLEFAFEADAAAIVIDRQQLECALLNLAINARDAMPEGGRLRIGTRLSSEPAPRLQIYVADTGGGMSPATVEHVLEPFFTTKPPGAGSGLGLAMVAAFIADCDGHVHIESELGRGTTVTLDLPLALAPARDPLTT